MIKNLIIKVISDFEHDLVKLKKCINEGNKQTSIEILNDLIEKINVAKDVANKF